MKKIRNARVADLIHQEICALLLKEIQDPRISPLLTITGVELSKDYKTAKVFFSLLEDESVKKETTRGLKSATGYIRKELARRLKLRHTPEINFISDNSIARGFRIIETMTQLSLIRGPEDKDTEEDLENS